MTAQQIYRQKIKYISYYKKLTPLFRKVFTENAGTKSEKELARKFIYNILNNFQKLRIDKNNYTWQDEFGERDEWCIL